MEDKSDIYTFMMFIVINDLNSYNYIYYEEVSAMCKVLSIDKQ